jgi:hypothetical protein
MKRMAHAGDPAKRAFHRLEARVGHRLRHQVLSPRRVVGRETDLIVGAERAPEIGIGKAIEAHAVADLGPGALDGRAGHIEALDHAALQVVARCQVDTQTTYQRGVERRAPVR